MDAFQRFLGRLLVTRPRKSVRHGAKNVRHCAENVHHGAENVRNGAENVRHGAPISQSPNPPIPYSMEYYKRLGATE